MLLCVDTYAVESPDTSEVGRSVEEMHLKAKLAEHVQVINAGEASSDHYNIVVVRHDGSEMMVNRRENKWRGCRREGENRLGCNGIADAFMIKAR